MGRRERAGRDAQWEVRQRAAARAAQQRAHRVLARVGEHVQDCVVALTGVDELRHGRRGARGSRHGDHVEAVAFASEGRIAELIAAHERERGLLARNRLVRTNEARDERVGGPRANGDRKWGALDVPKDVRLVRALHSHRVVAGDRREIRGDVRSVVVVDHRGGDQLGCIRPVEREGKPIATRRARVAVHVARGDRDELECAHARRDRGEAGAVCRAARRRRGARDDAKRVGRAQQLASHTRLPRLQHGDRADQVLARGGDDQVRRVRAVPSAARRTHHRGGRLQWGARARVLRVHREAEGRRLKGCLVRVVEGVARLDP